MRYDPAWVIGFPSWIPNLIMQHWNRQHNRASHDSFCSVFSWMLSNLFVNQRSIVCGGFVFFFYPCLRLWAHTHEVFAKIIKVVPILAGRCLSSMLFEGILIVTAMECNAVNRKMSLVHLSVGDDVTIIWGNVQSQTMEEQLGLKQQIMWMWSQYEHFSKKH